MPKSKFSPAGGTAPFVGRPIEPAGEPPAAGKVPSPTERTPEQKTAEQLEEGEEAPVGRKEVRRKKQPSRLGTFFKELPTRRIPLYAAVLIMLIPMALVAWLVYDLGVADGQELSDEGATKEGLQLPPEISASLDAALIALRNGDSQTAVRQLKALEKTPPGYPAVTYLVALAAMQDGNIDLSEQKVKESIQKRERVSDALALQAVLETQKGHDSTRLKMGDPRKRAESLLRQAIIADAANPYPHFELATLLRYRGEREEALREVKAAEARLNPVDSHMIMDIAAAIMELENTPDDKLPQASAESDDIRKLFPEAYAAMRRNDFASATTLLRKCRKLCSPDIFDYAVNDPAMRKYAHQPELAEFYQASP